MKTILVIGASGFVGGHLSRALQAEGYRVRCLARNLSRVQTLAEFGCEVVQGDISDPATLDRALKSVEAVYISIHTLSPQPATADAAEGFMEVEMKGLKNIVTACATNGVRRLIYITSLGTGPDAPGVWLRERWKTEQFLLSSNLDVTVIRPGFIVGVGGRGFDMTVSQAKKSVAINLLGSAQFKMRNTALDDLIYYLVGVLGDERAYGKGYDVGGDDILTNNQRIDVTSEILRRRHPLKINVPRAVMGWMAPIVEQISKAPRGSFKGFLDSLKVDAIGDPTPIRALLPRTPLSYRQAAERALTGPSATLKT